MHNTTKKNWIRLMSYEGEVIYEFTNYDQLLHHWPVVRKYRDIGFGFKRSVEGIAAIRERLLGRRIRRYYFYPSVVAWDENGPVDHHQYAIRDSFGDFLDPFVIQADYNERHPHIPKWRRGSHRRTAYGRFRHPRSTQEKRWVHAWDDEEFAPKVRAKRGMRYLPDAWDDYLSHNDKCWKTQSKRRHQWKEKS